MILDKITFRGSSAWKKKRKAILNRDDHKCKICGCTNNLQVHHILSISTHPTLRLEDTNLISVCTDCHEKIHNGIYLPIYLTNLIAK